MLDNSASFAKTLEQVAGASLNTAN